MSWRSHSVFLLGSIVLGAQAAQAAEITFYEGEDFHGRAFTTERRVENFRDFGFNDRASSVVVDSGRWEVCDDSQYDGNCVVLRAGAYDSLRRMGLNNRVTSVRPVGYSRRDDEEHVVVAEPLPSADYEWRRRPHERVYEARVTSVRAVTGSSDRHCWVERQEVRERSRPNVGGAVVGAVIGGIIGHQIGSGRGRDAATVGGAVVGGAIGANSNRDRGETYERNIRRCETSYDGDPDYWDVTYDYRGREHYVQMTEPPGDTLWVNDDGEPRG